MAPKISFGLKNKKALAQRQNAPVIPPTDDKETTPGPKKFLGFGTDGQILQEKDPEETKIIPCKQNLKKTRLADIIIKQQIKRQQEVDSQQQETQDAKQLLTDTKDPYEEMPVEEFGMAMLRGMGFNPEKDKEREAYKPKSVAAVMLGGSESILDVLNENNLNNDEKNSDELQWVVAQESPQDGQQEDGGSPLTWGLNMLNDKEKK